MSIKARLDDARILYATGRREGALLSLLVAVAATSRRRYPERDKNKPNGMDDGQAFKRFVHDEMETIGGAINLNVKCRGNMVPLQDVFYKFVRCELVHAASLPKDVRFIKSPQKSVKVDDDFVEFSDQFLGSISDAVIKAKENKDLFEDGITDVQVNLMMGPVIQVASKIDQSISKDAEDINTPPNKNEEI